MMRTSRRRKAFHEHRESFQAALTWLQLARPRNEASQHAKIRCDDADAIVLNSRNW